MCQLLLAFTKSLVKLKSSKTRPITTTPTLLQSLCTWGPLVNWSHSNWVSSSIKSSCWQGATIVHVHRYTYLYITHLIFILDFSMIYRRTLLSLVTEDGRSMTTFYYYSVNHQSGLQRNTFSKTALKLNNWVTFLVILTKSTKSWSDSAGWFTPTPLKPKHRCHKTGTID